MAKRRVSISGAYNKLLRVLRLGERRLPRRIFVEESLRRFARSNRNRPRPLGRRSCTLRESRNQTRLKYEAGQLQDERNGERR